MSYREPGGQLFETGWLPPRAAADALGITVRMLEARWRRGDVKRRELAPRSRVFVYKIE